MQQIDELDAHRKRRLAALVREKFSSNESELARALGYSSSGFIRAMLRDDSNCRAVTEKTVRKIDRLPGLSGWFSRTSSVEADIPPEQVAPRQARSRGVSFLEVKSVPVLTFADLSLMEVVNSDPRLKSAPRMAASAEAGPRAKAVQMNDDSMAPTMRLGDSLHFDPDLAPRPGDSVLVIDGTGTYYVREYRVRSGGSFEAAAHNPAHATLRSDVDGLRVVAVATHLVQTLRGRGSLLSQAAGSLLGAIGALFIGTALYVGELGPLELNQPSARSTLHSPMRRKRLRQPLRFA